MYLGQDFPPFQDQAARLLGVDMSQLLGVGEVINSVTSRLQTLSGPDNFPGVHLPNQPQFLGAEVAQLVVFDDAPGALIGNIYALSFSVTTSAGQVILPWGRFKVAPGFGITAYDKNAPPSSAQSVVLTAPPAALVLPILVGGYVGQDFANANQGETLNYGFDFESGMSPGEVITKAQIFLGLITGPDAAITASPTAYSSGAPAISGSVVTQLTVWPPGDALVGNVYAFNLTAVTSFNQAMTAWARITIGAIA